jgi:hypothetical protein
VALAAEAVKFTIPLLPGVTTAFTTRLDGGSFFPVLFFLEQENAANKKS